MTRQAGKFEHWQQIETIFLDMDGTLLDLYFDNHFWLQHVPEVYAQKHQLSDEQANEELMQRYQAARGSLDWYCIDYWSEQLDLDIRQLKRELAHRIALRPNVTEFLQAINTIDKRVVMVTNAHPATVEIKLEQTGIDVHFDRIIDSHAIGLAKEQAGFWQQLQSAESYDRDSTMLIDDNLEVLQSAADYGIAHLFGIRLPDSQRGHVDATPFVVIDDFAEFIGGIER